MVHKEGRRIRSQIPIDAITPFIMPTRAGASNSFSATVNIDKCEELIRKLREDGMKSLGMIHIFMAAYIRVIAELPGINRFISGQRLYARNNIEICMVMKKSRELNAPETVIKLDVTPEETIETVYNLLNGEISLNKNEGDNNSTDTAARVLIGLPSFLLRFTVWMLKIIDYLGILPRFLTKLSPFHGSLFITNMGSLGMPPIYHHLYNFGNLPVFIAMGAKRTVYETDSSGAVQKMRVIDFNVTCDERICDGHYYATAFKKLRRLLESPEKLLLPPEEIIRDID